MDIDINHTACFPILPLNRGFNQVILLIGTIIFTYIGLSLCWNRSGKGIEIKPYWSSDLFFLLPEQTAKFP